MPDTDPRPSVPRSRSSNSINHDSDNHHHHQTHHHRHKPKQFHVTTRGHGRIPSYGRNLNKLGGKPATSPKARHHHGSDSDSAGQRTKRATFELGSPDSSFTEAPAAAAAAATPTTRLHKSPSYHSLDKSPGLQRSAMEPKDKSSDSLMTLPVAALPPPTPPSHHLAPITPAHSLPSSQEQPLTSRFEHTSPSSNNDSQILSRRTPASDTAPPSIPRSNSTYSVTSTSRTQQKLWLQRASSQADLPPAPSGAVPGDRFERITREYMNVRRFKNPLGDGVERVRNARGRMVIPKRAGDGEGNMGLSRSLNEMEGRRRRRTGTGIGKGSRDDMGVVNGVSGVQPVGEVEALLKRLWTRGEMLPSNE